MAQKKKAKPAKTKVSKKLSSKSGSGKSKAKAQKYVYDFGTKTDGDSKQRELLGGKGANLAEMAKIGLPVPPGFTITTEVCTYFYANKKILSRRVGGSS
jgi:pyruvate,orthophosphate dikinase